MMDLLEPLDTKHQAIIDALPEDKREPYLELFAMTQRTRVAYGYPANPADMLTFEEMKAGEMRNAEAVTMKVITELAGTKAGEDWLKRWLNAMPVSDRDLPSFAYHTVTQDCWTPEQELDLVCWAWTDPEWPEGNYGARVWRELWERIGFVHERLDEDDTKERDQSLPTAPVRLYRGAIASRKKGMAWTPDLDRAKWFARRLSPTTGTRNGGLRVARVWTTLCPPDRVYARFDGRREEEWVIDTRGLRIEPYEGTD
jgi:hypothetical protein